VTAEAPTVKRATLRAACPHCAAVFQLNPAQMDAREGLVRCGACRKIFNAKWHLVAREGGAGSAPGADFAAGNFAAALAASAEAAAAAPPPVAESPAEHQRSPARARNVDHYLKPRAHPLAGLAWAAVALASLALLGAQVKFLLVEKYASHDALRPYLAAFCEVAACNLPARHDPRRITLTRTHIDLHPAQPGALRVTVKLVNEATYPQVYPRLRLTLTDRDGWVVGRRTYAPADYLSGRANQLRSGELGTVHLDLARPHEKAVGFEIDVIGDAGI